MTVTNGYCSLAEYKAWITMRGGTISTDAADDAVIEAMIEAASRYIDRETGQRFYLPATDETRYYTTDDPLHAKIDPFGSITSVSVDYDLTRTYTALVATDYDTLPDNAAADNLPFTGLEIAIGLSSTAYFPTTRKGIKIVGKVGWPATPKDITDATLMMVQSIYGSRSGQTSAGKVTVTAAGVVIRPEDVPALAQKIIQHYRSWV